MNEDSSLCIKSTALFLQGDILGTQRALEQLKQALDSSQNQGLAGKSQCQAIQAVKCQSWSGGLGLLMCLLLPFFFFFKFTHLSCEREKVWEWGRVEREGERQNPKQALML